jgi:tetratricopeptide (TPR) repeat protein
MAPAMSRYTERPMARAHEHLASARYAEAAGAFRAVLRIDPNEFQAHFGLADALVARGQHAEAVEGLVAAAESCTAREDNGAALTLYGKALAVDPMRLELHLDVAMAEAALGRMEAAQSRLEHLAEVYMQAGRTDEAAEVYRCIAGWEGEGEEIEPELEDVPEVQRRVTEVPAAAPRDAVPMMVPTSETVVISTILITPDGQLYQVPSEPQAEAWTPTSGDTVPPLPADMLEVVHSAPLELAEGEEVEGVERTVVGFPPPPPSLPEGYESAAHTVDRAALEDAVVAALDNLAQLEEEDATLVMQRLPPNHKLAALRRAASGESRLPEFVTRSRMPKPELPPEPEPELVDEELEADEELAVDEELAAALPEPEPTPESKLRIRPAPRPVTKTPAPVPGMGPQPVAAKPASAAGRAAAPSGAATPGPAGSVGKASAPVGASRPVASKPVESKPVAASRPVAASKPATSRPVAASGAAKLGSAAAKPGAASSPARATGLAKPVIGGGQPSAGSRPAASGSAAAAKPSAGSKPASMAGKPAATSKPGAPASSVAARTSNVQRPTSGTIRSSVTSSPAATSKPAPASKPAFTPARSTTTAAAARPSPALGAARSPSGEAPKATRPDNPLAERLRRRAGLQKPDAAPNRAEPRQTDPRATEPIVVRSPSTLPPVNKKK